MKDKFEQLTVLCILEVPRASSVLSKRDGSGEVFFSFPSHDDDPKQQKDAHSAVDAFLRAKGERGFFRVFKEYGPLRMFQEQLTLREVLRFQEYARMLRTDRLDLEFIRHCDELSRNPEAADDPLLALIQPPQLIPVWSQPFHVLGVCNDILEALGFTSRRGGPCGIAPEKIAMRFSYARKTAIKSIVARHAPSAFPIVSIRSVRSAEESR